jgi:plastocyanin
MYAVQPVTTDLLWSNALGWNTSLSKATATSYNETPQIVDVVVGAQGKLAFNPESVTVLPGTLLRFDFLGRNLSDIRAIGESEGYKRGQGQLLGTLRTAQDSREIRQNPTNNEHDHRNIEHFI